MIPYRVYLRGFLSYRDEQEVRFDSSSLWMLSGLNGSGKSTVFDAVTFALFGHHRGGHQRAHELINKESNSATVEFDFTQDGQLCRVKRTLQRNNRGGSSGTQQVLQWQKGNNGDGGGKWVPVEDTSRKTEFDAWVANHIGLTYETFTSSVLLLQGKAEKLLDSTAKGRFEVLASIVDLQRYQRLHEKADAQRKGFKARLEVLRNQLTALPEVTELELVAAQNRIEDARETRKAAQAEVERWQAFDFQAQRWAEVQTKLLVLRGRWQTIQGLLREADRIRQDMQRLGELREVLPHLETVVKQRGQIHSSELKIEQLSRERRELEEKIAARARTAEETKQQRQKIQQRMAKDETRLREIGEELVRLEGVLTRAREHARQKQVLAQQEQELSRLPTDTLQAQENAQQKVDHLGNLAQVLPLLERLATQREGLRSAQATEVDRLKEEEAIRKEGEQRAAERSGLHKKTEAAIQARQQADQALSAVQALFQQLEEGWTSFTELEGARTCRQCGQPLTPGHFEEEKARREKELAEIRARLQEAAAQQRSVLKQERQLGQLLKEADEKLEQTREAFREARGGVQQARRDIERHQEECQLAYRDLPEAFRVRVAPTPPDDWRATTYPTADDLQHARKEVKTLEAMRKELREAQRLHADWCTLQAKVATTRQAVQALQAELPPDLPGLHQKHAALGADRVTLTERLQAQREQERQAESDREALLRECENLQKQRAEREAKIKAEEATRKHCEAAVTGALKRLSPTWQAEAERAGLAELHGWQHEKEQLESADTEQKSRDLEQAQAGLEEVRQQLEGLEAEGQQVPAEARRPVTEVRERLASARREQETCEETFHKAQQDHLLLTRQKEQREALQQEILDGEREQNIFQQLSHLLGRDRLQLYLVRQAERQIVDQANAVLDRLSGGQLYLRLSGGEEGDGGADHALELEAYNRTTGQAPINVAFLSGSQRFRVAVALALGIGQYASRQHRPIESVIIDEGFGCLDRNGRQVMIQELQNLRGQLHCILLVSHQEEFADAFNDGYLFELDDGSTRVKRIQR